MKVRSPEECSIPQQHLISHIVKLFFFILFVHFENLLDLHLVLLMCRGMRRLQVLLNDLIDLLVFLQRTQLAFQLFVLLIDWVETRIAIGM